MKRLSPEECRERMAQGIAKEIRKADRKYRARITREAMGAGSDFYAHHPASEAVREYKRLCQTARAAIGQIYFISLLPRFPRVYNVKIGISRDPQERIRAIIRDHYRGERALGQYDQAILVQRWPDHTLEDEISLHHSLRKQGIGDSEWYVDSVELRAALNGMGYHIEQQPYEWPAPLKGRIAQRTGDR